MHVLRNTDRERFRLDFLVHGPEKYDFEDEAKGLGAGVIRCLYPRRPWTYARNFRRILIEHGPYDAVHCHAHTFSGLAVYLAARAGVPWQIVHTHCDTPDLDVEPGLLRCVYLAQMRAWIGKHTTHGLAVSRVAERSLFGSGRPVPGLANSGRRAGRGTRDASRPTRTMNSSSTSRLRSSGSSRRRGS